MITLIPNTCLISCRCLTNWLHINYKFRGGMYCDCCGKFCFAIMKSLRPLLILLEASWERLDSVGATWLATSRPGSLLPVPRVKCRPPPRTKPLSLPLPTSTPPLSLWSTAFPSQWQDFFRYISKLLNEFAGLGNCATGSP